VNKQGYIFSNIYAPGDKNKFMFRENSSKKKKGPKKKNGRKWGKMLS